MQMKTKLILATALAGCIAGPVFSQDVRNTYIASGAQIANGIIDLATKVTGILPAVNGGAGTINGALKGNGSGTVSQAASTDLSDTTTATTWTPTDQSGAGLTLTNNGAHYGKINKMCIGMFRVVYPSTANGAGASISLPCTLPNDTNTAIGSCFSDAGGNNSVMSLLGFQNTATALFWNTVAGLPANSAFSTKIVSCNFAFVSQ